MLRFAYGCLPSLPSLYFANTMIRRGGLIPSSIVLSVGGLRFQKKKYSTAGALPLLLRRFGPRFTGYMALVGLGVTLPSLRLRSTGDDRLLGFKQLARMHDIPLVLSEDFSSEGTIAELESHGLDLFVTCMCDQILREPLLGRPAMGCVNIHASLLPDFRGVDSIFQAMLHDVVDIGATIHRTGARIDCGDSYGQLGFARQPADSHLLLLAKAAGAGVQLLQRHVRSIERGDRPEGTPIDPAAARYPYRSWPERSELRQFRDKDLVFWRGSDFRRMLRFDDVLEGEQLVPYPRSHPGGMHLVS